MTWIEISIYAATAINAVICMVISFTHIRKRRDRMKRWEPTPLELMDTEDLVQEIKRRNDLTVIFWGRDSSDGKKYNVSRIWSGDKNLIQTLCKDLAKTLRDSE